MEIENAVEKSKLLGMKRKTLKEVKKEVPPELEDELYNFCQSRAEHGIQTTKADLLNHAKEIDQDQEWSLTNSWVKGFCERYSLKIDANHILEKDLIIQFDRTTTDEETKIALKSAEFLLNFIDSKGDLFLLKDIITVRMIRDRIREMVNID